LLEKVGHWRLATGAGWWAGGLDDEEVPFRCWPSARC